MIWLELVFNLSLLVALSVVSGFVDTRWARNTRQGQLLQGLVFGGAAMIGMLHPLVLAPGLIFDGRSVMISLCGLFFGPLAASVAGFMTVTLRLAQGGPGMVMGVLTVLTSAGLGVAFYSRLNRLGGRMSTVELLGFGVLVHLAMLAMMSALPGEIRMSVFRSMALPVMTVFPLATLLVGKILAEHRLNAGSEAALRRSKAYLQTVLDSVNDAVSVDDAETGRILDVNQRMCEMYGYTREEVRSISIGDLSEGNPPYSQAEALEWMRKARETGSQTFPWRARHKDGHLFWVEVSIRLTTIDGKHRYVVVARDIAERMKAEEVLRESEETFRKRENLLNRIFEVLPIGLWFADREGNLFRGNPAGVRIWGAEPHVPLREYGIFKAWRLPGREPVAPDEWALARTIREGVTIENELLEIEAFDGTRKTILNYTAPVLNEEGRLDGAIVVNLDVSDRIALEDQLRQAQRMESIGRLAGGVAHDFNNLLMGIMGYVELSLDQVGSSQPVRGYLDEVMAAAERSAGLTRQLLAFARKQPIAPKVLDLNDTAGGMLKLLRRLIGESIDLAWMPGPKLGSVRMDPGQVDQVLVNLCVNARDAIAGVGRVIIGTENADVDDAFCRAHPDASPGAYVMLAVSDDGCGMNEETQAHLFEPFFTTKGVGEGTGLGLATVYGIVKQNHGFILVHSEPGKGSAFRIYIPRLDGTA